MAKDLEAALKSLDPKNDEHWTGDGLPRMDALHELTGNAELTRKQVGEAAPNFTRDNPQMEKGDAPAPNGATDQGTTTPGPDEAAKAESDKPKEPAAPDENQDVDGAKTEADTDAPSEPPSPPAIENDKPGQPPSDNPDDNINVDDEPTTPPADRPGKPEEPDLEAEADELAGLDADLEDAEARLAKANERMNELNREREELQAARDKIIMAREARKDPDDDLKARLAFIRSQAAVRADRAGAAKVAQELRDAVLGPRSQLDKSMGDRPGRFTARPPVQPRRNQDNA